MRVNVLEKLPVYETIYKYFPLAKKPSGTPSALKLHFFGIEAVRIVPSDVISKLIPAATEPFPPFMSSPENREATPRDVPLDASGALDFKK